MYCACKCTVCVHSIVYKSPVAIMDTDIHTYKICTYVHCMYVCVCDSMENYCAVSEFSIV